jgi:hypothetical protein
MSAWIVSFVSQNLLWPPMFGILWSPSLRLKVRQRENLLSIFVTHVWSADSVVRCYLGVLLFIVNGWNKSEAKGKDYHYWFAVICCVREALDALARSFSACVAVCQSQAIGQTRAKSKHALNITFSHSLSGCLMFANSICCCDGCDWLLWRCPIRNHH